MNRSQIDPNNMFASIFNFPKQMEEAINIGKKITIKGNYNDCNNILFLGMGGSAIGGDVIKALIQKELKIPFVVNRNYNIPNWVNENTIVICSSYSGNTEETLSAFDQAVDSKAKLIGISTGGKLTNIIEKKGYDLIKIPDGLQPRAALAYSFIPVYYFLAEIGLCSNNIEPELTGAISSLKKKRDLYSVEMSSNPVYKMAKEIYGMIPIIYGVTDTTAVVAQRWKGQFCENSKMLAYHNEIPELNHNEIVGWGNNKDLLNEMSVIWLRDKNDNERVKIRQDVSKQILNDLDIMQHEIKAEGENNTERLLDMINFGDWLSYWCAILHNTDPTPVKNIDILKEALGKIS